MTAQPDTVVRSLADASQAAVDFKTAKIQLRAKLEADLAAQILTLSNRLDIATFRALQAGASKSKIGQAIGNTDAKTRNARIENGRALLGGLAEPAVIEEPAGAAWQNPDGSTLCADEPFTWADAPGWLTFTARPTWHGTSGEEGTARFAINDDGGLEVENDDYTNPAAVALFARVPVAEQLREIARGMLRNA